jgi:hypothetical protein
VDEDEDEDEDENDDKVCFRFLIAVTFFYYNFDRL